MAEYKNSKPSLRGHTNKEDMRECPYCGKEVLSRGLYVHVYNSDDDEHGPRDSVPDGFDTKDAPIVGKREVTILNPTEYRVDHKRYICEFCNKTFRGELGLKIHLGRTAGKDDIHPPDAEDRDIDSFQSFPSTENGEIIVDTEEQAKELEGIDAGIFINEEDEPIDTLLPTEGGNQSSANSIPLSEIEKLRNEFLENDEEGRQATWFHAADRIQALIDKHAEN